MPVSGRIAVSAVMLAIFAGMVAMATGYPPQSRFLPLVIGIPAVVLCLVQLAIDVVALRRESGLPVAEETGRLRPAGVLFAWLVGIMTMILLFGFLIATPLVLFGFLRWHQREPAGLSAALAGGGLVTMWLVFDLLLKIPLHDGFVIDWLFG